jgi:2,7-dihydroxy-5-methyl-1-naphthoate 7-O-methyltransferase
VPTPTPFGPTVLDAAVSDRPPGEVLADMVGILRPAAVRAMATLRVADHIAAGTTAAAALAPAVGADLAALTKLLRYLASVGVLRRGPDEEYGLTEVGALLRSDDPGGAREFLDSDGVTGRADLGLVNLLHTVRTGTACHASVFGADFWTDVQHDPSYVQSLDRQLGAGIGWDAELIVTGYPWAGVGSVTDVGGSTGGLLIALLEKYDHLRGRVVDLPNAVTLARRNLADAGLADRGDAVVGSYFDELPGGSDVYVLSAILADWTDAQAIEILRRVAAAAGPDGTVLLSEVTLRPVAEHAEDVVSTGTDLYVAATVTAPTREVPELVTLAGAAGLRLTFQGPSTPARSLLGFSVVTA